ncbi:MAG TPA: hypothetical protein VIS72_02335 [Anaerolineales bacterium]
MDYSTIIENLKRASLFDLYRLSVAIDHQLENPQRIAEVKKHIKPGQTISYFEPTENSLIEAKVINLKRTKVLVENTHDQQRWTIPLYWVNLDEVNTDIVTSSGKRLDKSQLRVGDMIGFRNRQNIDVHGEIIRLNQKTVTIKTDTDKEWLVGYEWLHLIIDGEQESPHLIESHIMDDK